MIRASTDSVTDPAAPLSPESAGATDKLVCRCPPDKYPRRAARVHPILGGMGKLVLAHAILDIFCHPSWDPPPPP